ncbi:MAG: hypothetical protein KBS86_00750 [Proteobacteria bacterium]|nr:hypothetical protein [Candidatus Enterousia scatequi]
MLQRWKKILYVLVIVGVAFWIGFRIWTLVAEHNRVVFNISRMETEFGVPVQTMIVKNETDILYEPLTIKNNRALVTGARVGLFRAGQSVSTGKIVSVSSKIDLDTGMHVIKTRGVPDGLQYAEYRRNGYFVPVYAVHDNQVFVVKDGVAVAQKVIIAREDANRVLITHGLNDGDMVILSNVVPGAKVQESK